MSTWTATLPGSTTPLQADGTFHFSGIQPGTCRIQVNVAPDGHHVQKLVAKEAKISGREITITGGNDVDLTVTLGLEQGQVTGVVELDGKPAAGVMVLLVPKSGQEMEEDSRLDEGDSDGTFSLGGIVSGDYVLLAIKDGWDLECSKSEVLRPYLSAGQKNVHRCESVSERDRIGPREQSSDGTKATIVPPTKRLTRTAAPDRGRR